LYAAAVTITYGGAIWAFWMLIEVLGSYLRARAETTASRFDDLLVPLIVRTLKIAVVVIGVIAIVHAIVPSASTELLAGVGIGGLALALAAKDAIANLFGSLMIIAERPFEIGDWIHVGDIDGSVETVGMRSTRVRTFYNSLVTIPNSELTTATIDNYGKRKYRRIKTTLGVTYDTSPELMESFCEGIRQLIREHPYTRKDYYHVYFHDYGAYSLDILVYCFVQTPEWGTELRERHRLMTDILRLARSLGVEFAFPTQTNIVHMNGGHDGGASNRPRPMNTYDANRKARAAAVEIIEDTLGRGMKPPPVDYAQPIFDPKDLLDAKKAACPMTKNEDDGDGNGN
jgi:MscS family membrane protein